MGPEGERVRLDTMEDVQIATDGILYYHRVIKPSDVSAVRLARSQENLPMTLSTAKSDIVKQALAKIAQERRPYRSVTIGVAEDWQEQLQKTPEESEAVVHDFPAQRNAHEFDISTTPTAA